MMRVPVNEDPADICSGPQVRAGWITETKTCRYGSADETDDECLSLDTSQFRAQAHTNNNLIIICMVTKTVTRIFNYMI